MRRIFPLNGGYTPTHLLLSMSAALYLGSGCTPPSKAKSVAEPSPIWFSPRENVLFRGTVYTIGPRESVLREVASGKAVHNFERGIGARMQLASTDQNILATVTNPAGPDEVHTFRLEYFEPEGHITKDPTVVDGIPGIPTQLLRLGSFDYVRADVYSKPIREDFQSMSVLYAFNDKALVGTTELMGVTFSGDSITYLEADGKATVVTDPGKRSLVIPKTLLPEDYLRHMTLGEDVFYYIDEGNLIACKGGLSTVAKKVSTKASLFSLRGATYLYDRDASSHSLHKLVDGSLISTNFEYSTGPDYVLVKRTFLSSGYIDFMTSLNAPRTKIVLVDVARETIRVKSFDQLLESTQLVVADGSFSIITENGMEAISFE